MMNTMKKYILGFVIAVCLWACSKEDWPSNDQLEVNFFCRARRCDRRGS